MTYNDSDGITYDVFLNVCDELNIACPDDPHSKGIPACQLKPDEADFGKVMGKTDHMLLRYG